MIDRRTTEPPAQTSPGRSCPLHYRYAPTSFARDAEAECETLYVVGGLYGNESALNSVLELFDREIGHKRLVFNGDFNWFNVAPASFESINRRVLGFDALRGKCRDRTRRHRPERWRRGLWLRLPALGG